jgi:hypothetical protein
MPIGVDNRLRDSPLAFELLKSTFYCRHLDKVRNDLRSTVTRIICFDRYWMQTATLGGKVAGIS